jgi:thymidylate kinase
MFITFSGLDGSGKSTIISNLRDRLEKRNHRVTVLTMYGQVSLYGIIRNCRDLLFKSAKQSNYIDLSNHDKIRAAISETDAPLVEGRFQQIIVKLLRKNCVKRIVFVIDLFILIIFRFIIERINKNIFILDRYFYDFLADVAEGDKWFYTRIFLSLAPTPSIPIFIDVSAEESFRRKGEYSVRHLQKRRKVYAHIFQWVEEMIFVPNDNLDLTVSIIEDEVIKKL